MEYFAALGLKDPALFQVLFPDVVVLEGTGAEWPVYIQEWDGSHIMSGIAWTNCGLEEFHLELTAEEARKLTDGEADVSFYVNKLMSRSESQ